jgi:hypothetical protein
MLIEVLPEKSDPLQILSRKMYGWGAVLSLRNFASSAKQEIFLKSMICGGIVNFYVIEVDPEDVDNEGIFELFTIVNMRAISPEYINEGRHYYSGGDMELILKYNGDSDWQIITFNPVFSTEKLP